MKHKLIGIILLLLFVIAAYVFLIKGVKPFLEAVVSSDLFLVQTDDPADKNYTVSNEKSRLAALQCNQYLRDNFEGVTIGELTEDDYTAWALGGYTYVINSSTGGKTTGNPMRDKFVCKIQWIEGDPLEFESWEIQQFEYTPPNTTE